MRMAGSSNRAMGNFPNRSCKVNHASMAPGMVTGSHPTVCIWPRAKMPSASNAAGERPEPLKPCKRCASQCKQKASDPKPLLVGSVTVSAAAVAMAASTLVPPSANISSRPQPPTADLSRPSRRRARGGWMGMTTSAA